jgi:NAD(P)-dependent dehydrogenase (short-subunit alcohol dehydrogenase family)
MRDSRGHVEGEDAMECVLITGGTDGLGKATALLLAGEGYRVFAGGRNAQKRTALDAEAKQRNLPLQSLEMDVTDDASVDRAIGIIHEEAGPVDILINNAGIAFSAVIEEITLADFRKQFETNFFGVVRVTQHVLPEMRKRCRGRVINVSSVSGKMAPPVLGPYSSTKFALEAISDAMRIELLPFGVYVILIEPGHIPSDMERASAELSSRYLAGAEKSPYAAVYSGFQHGWANWTKSPKYTPADCARVILDAIRANSPRARYPVTRRAKIVTLMKRLLTDRALDRMMGRLTNVPRAGNQGPFRGA